MVQDESIDVSLLEPVLREFVRCIGLAATMAIVRAYGGNHLYLPSTRTDDSALARLIGADLAWRLASTSTRGYYVYIPKAERAIRAARDARIRALRLQRTAADLATEYGLTVRRVRGIYAMDKGEPEADLFNQ